MNITPFYHMYLYLCLLSFRRRNLKKTCRITALKFIFSLKIFKLLRSFVQQFFSCIIINFILLNCNKYLGLYRFVLASLIKKSIRFKKGCQIIIVKVAQTRSYITVVPKKISQPRTGWLRIMRIS